MTHRTLSERMGAISHLFYGMVSGEPQTVKGRISEIHDHRGAGAKATIAKPGDRSEIHGFINSIAREDGSGRRWLVRVAGTDKYAGLEVVMYIEQD